MIFAHLFVLMNATSFASAKRYCAEFNYFDSKLFDQVDARYVLGNTINDTKIWVDFGILHTLILNKKDFNI